MLSRQGGWRSPGALVVGVRTAGHFLEVGTQVRDEFASGGDVVGAVGYDAGDPQRAALGGDKA